MILLHPLIVCVCSQGPWLRNPWGQSFLKTSLSPSESPPRCWSQMVSSACSSWTLEHRFYNESPLPGQCLVGNFRHWDQTQTCCYNVWFRFLFLFSPLISFPLYFPAITLFSAYASSFFILFCIFLSLSLLPLFLSPFQGLRRWPPPVEAAWHWWMQVLKLLSIL